MLAADDDGRFSFCTGIDGGDEILGGPCGGPFGGGGGVALAIGGYDGDMPG
jgi:hypothetical protein